MDQKPKIRAGRRRPTAPTQPAERERAEAPQREREREGSGTQPPSYTGETSGGSPFGSGRKMSLPVMLLVLAILAVIAICGGPNLLGSLLGSTGQVSPPQDFESQPQDEVGGNLPAPTSAPIPTKRPTLPPSTSTEDDTWLVMLYQDADDKVLEQDIFIDLNEAEKVGSSDRVHIVAQVDRYKGGFEGNGSWSDTRRYFVTQDDDLQTVHSEVVENLGEVNMADGQSLVDFVTWAVQTYPASKHALILSDHGMGWPGGWSDSGGGGSVDRSIPMTAALGDQIYLMELDQALDQALSQSGIDKFELIGMDACLMSHLEVLSALQPHGRYMVASQETEPSLGWAYTSFLQDLVDQPQMDGRRLSELIVDSYIKDDQRIVDNQARQEFLNQGRPMSSFFTSLGGPSAAQLAQQLQDTVTLSAVDLQAVDPLVAAVDDLALALKNENQNDVARARTYAQSFTNIFGNQVPPSYIDLGNFTGHLSGLFGSSPVSQAADAVRLALSQAVIAEKHGPKRAGATGISIYFPNSTMYRSPVSGPASYTAIANRFAANSLWDDYLAYHFTGREFQSNSREMVIPESGTPVRGPGSGGIQVSPLTLSSQTAAPGRPVLLSADISGQNIGHIYIFAGYQDLGARSIMVADTDYLESSDTREIEGVYYPVWPSGQEFTLEFEWEPLMFAITDGVTTALALLDPESYGASPEDAIYSVDGIYNFVDGSEPRSATMNFSNGSLRSVFAFTGDQAGAPREVTPQPGDTFTILQKWLDLDSSGKVEEISTQDGDTLTFGSDPFTWVELDAAVGEYIVGFIVTDLDGNQYPVYAQVRVQ